MIANALRIHSQGTTQGQTISKILRATRSALLLLCFGLASVLISNADAKERDPDGDVWWSLKTVVRPAPPNGAAANPIDRFINDEINRRGLKASELRWWSERFRSF